MVRSICVLICCWYCCCFIFLALCLNVFIYIQVSNVGPASNLFHRLSSIDCSWWVRFYQTHSIGILPYLRVLVVFDVVLTALNWTTTTSAHNTTTQYEQSLIFYTRMVCVCFESRSLLCYYTFCPFYFSLHASNDLNFFLLLRILFDDWKRTHFKNACRCSFG